MSNLDVVKSAYAAFARGDADALLAKFDEQIEWRPAQGHPYAPDGGPWVGHDEVVANLLMRVAADWDGFSATPAAFHDAGETVAVEGRYGGSYRASGASLDAPFCHVWTVRDGKVAVFRQYVDTAHLSQVMRST